MLAARTSSLVLAVAACAALAGCNSCDPEVVVPPGDIVGRACDPDGGDGLAHAGLRLEGPATRENIADADGDFRFDHVPPGSYTLTASAGDVTREYSVEVVARETSTVVDTACREAPYPPGTGGVAGQICNRHTGGFVQDADVLIALADGGLLAGATDDEGHFDIRAVPAGPQIVTVRGEGYLRSFLVDIVEGETSHLDLAEDCEQVTLGEGGVVGSFCDPSTGGDLVGADVVVSDGVEEVHDITDLHGEFEVNGLVPGSYAVTVVGGDYAFEDLDVTVVAGELTPVVDGVRCPRDAVGRIEGLICDAAMGGRFIGDVHLLAGAGVEIDTVESDDGSFRFEGVPPGIYKVRAVSADGERTWAGIVVEPFRTSFVQEIDCPRADDICTEVESEPDTQADGRIMLVVDRSASMESALSGDGVRKWDALRGALENVTAALDDTVEFGLMLYPTPDPGGDAFCGEGEQRIQMGPGTAPTIASILDSVVPAGGTPTSATLTSAASILEPLRADGRPLAVLLATDGGPNCNTDLDGATCRCTNPDSLPGQCSDFNCLDDIEAVAAVQDLEARGIDTYVVGVTGVASFGDVLDRMAVTGGTALTGTPKFYEANDQTALQQALEEIASRVLSCRVHVDADLDAAGSINVSIGGIELPRDGARQNGWDALDAHTVELFGAACDIVVASTSNVRVRTCS